jgi:hypothetical protein
LLENRRLSHVWPSDLVGDPCSFFLFPFFFFPFLFFKIWTYWKFHQIRIFFTIQILFTFEICSHLKILFRFVQIEFCSDSEFLFIFQICSNSIFCLDSKFVRIRFFFIFKIYVQVRFLFRFKICSKFISVQNSNFIQEKRMASSLTRDQSPDLQPPPIYNDNILAMIHIPKCKAYKISKNVKSY